MWTSSINSRSPDPASPNSYFVSARISPASRPRAAPRSNSSGRRRHHPLPQPSLDQTAGRHVVAGDRRVVGAVGPLRRRGDDRCRQLGVLRQAVGQAVAVDQSLAGGVPRPEGGVGDPGDVRPDDDLDRQRMCRRGDQHVGVGNRDGVVVDDVGGVFEPPGRELVEHLPLVRHAGDDPVERGEAVGGDEQPIAVGQAVRHADLADASVVERELDVGERGRRWGRGHRCHNALACRTPFSNRRRPRCRGPPPPRRW